MSESTMLVVDRSQMVRIYQLAGLLAADAWDNEKLVSRITNLTAEDLDRMEKQEDREMLEKLLAVSERNESFEVVGDKKKKSNSKEDSEMSTDAVAAAPNMEKKPKAPKKEPAPKENRSDRFGCRLGADSAKINAALSTTFTLPADIAAKAGLDEKRVVGHLKFWSKKKEGVGKFLENDKEKGWRLNMEDSSGGEEE